MAISLQDIDYSSLSRDDRRLLIDALEQSLASVSEHELFTDEQLAELDRRLDAADAGEIVGDPWPVVMNRLMTK